MGWGYAAGAGMQLVGDIINADASKTAAQTQAKAGQEALQEQRSEFAQTQKMLAPYRQVGGEALTALSDALGLPGASQMAAEQWGIENMLPQLRQHMADIGQPLPEGWQPSPELVQQWASMAPASVTAPTTLSGSLTKPFNFDISQDPGYQFRLSQGTGAIENSAAAKGMQLSGATLKDLMKFGQDFASGEFNQAFQRDQATKNQLFSMLTGATGIGTGATNTAVGAGQTNATNIGNTLTGIGNATAAGQIGGSLGNSLGNAGNSMMSYMTLRNMMNQNQATTPIMSGAGSSGYSSADLMAG